MAALPLSFTYGKSTGAAKACLAACLGPTTAAASALLNEKNWRANYYRHFLEANARMLAAAPADCVRMCEAGLAAAREQFSVDGVTLGELERSWDRADPASPFGTRVVVGLGPPCSFTCPFDPGEAPQDLAATITTVEALVLKGAAEPSVVRSLRILSENAAWQSEANRENVFVVLGAGSQMGPARCLLSLGCTVIAVDLNGKPDVWNRLIAYAETTNGTLLIPVRKAREDAGCNVLTEFLDIALWILEVADRRTSGKRIVMATFLYADGAVFSRLAVAADAIARAVIAKRPDTALQSLCSPTECFSVPSEANEEASRRYESFDVHTPWMRAVETLSMGRYLERNQPLRVRGAEGSERVHLLQDSFVWQQGPNYAFAKLLQRWRNLVVWWKGGAVTSNVAPASLTASVMHNRLIRAGMLGCQFFGIVPFQPATSNSLMTALALHDLSKHQDEGGDPRQSSAGHPMDLFMANAVHGGTWRCAFKTNSYTEVSAVIYGLKSAAPYGAAAAAVGVLASRAMSGRGSSRL